MVSKTCASQKRTYIRIGEDSFEDFKLKNSIDISVSADLFCPESGGNRFLRNLVTSLPNYTVSSKKYSNLRANLFIFFFWGGRHFKQDKQYAWHGGSFAWPLLQWKLNSSFFHIISKRKYFRSKFIENKMHVLIFSSTLSKEYLILGWIQINIIINISRISSQMPIFLVKC